MKSLALALFLLAVPAAQAAKYQTVSHPRATDLRALKDHWQRVTRNFDDVGLKTVRILERKPGERWENSIKQILWGSYTESVSATRIPVNAGTVRSSVDQLYDAHARLAEAPYRWARTYFSRALLTALNKPGRLLYRGGIEGAFSSSFSHLTVVDTEHQEVISFFAGYSE